MLTVRIQVIDGTGTFTQSDSQPCRLLTSLALFSVPVIVLEPVKPLAAYLAATGQIMISVLTLIVGELLKLVLIERLFSLTRDKLMKIPAFV